MTRSVFVFECSTDEGFSYVLEFSGLVLTGRTFQVLVKDRATSTVRATLALGDGLTLESASVISAAVAKSAMTAWPRGEYSADLVDTTGGGASRIMAVRFSYDLPGNLVNGVGNRKAFVSWSDNTALVTATGAVGPSGPPGPQGWSPELATVSDGARRVLQVVDWVGGLGTKPDAGDYVGATGLVPLIADAIDIRGPQGLQGIQGDQGPQGIQGIQGQKGWSPALAVIADDQRRVLQVIDWVGGAGSKPATGDYVGLTGLVAAIEDAIDIRGPAGSVLAPGSISTSDLADDAVEFAKMQNIASARVLGRNTPGSGDIEELDKADLATILGGLAVGDFVIVQTGGKLPALDAANLKHKLPPGHINGLTLSNDVSDPTNDIVIAPGKARDSTDSVDIILPTGLTKRLDAAWAVGSGNGGRDTGSIANGWWHVHAIYRADTEAADVIESLSATAPTLPTDYTHFRRLGSILRESGTIVAFSQAGNQFLWKTARLNVNAASPSSGAYYVVDVPPGVQVEAMLRQLWIGSALSYCKVRSPDQSATAASSSDFDLAITSAVTVASTAFDARTDTLGRVYASTTTSLTQLSLVTVGWNDPL